MSTRYDHIKIPHVPDNIKDKAVKDYFVLQNRVMELLLRALKEKEEE